MALSMNENNTNELWYYSSVPMIVWAYSSCPVDNVRDVQHLGILRAVTTTPVILRLREKQRDCRGLRRRSDTCITNL